MLMYEYVEKMLNPEIKINIAKHALSIVAGIEEKKEIYISLENPYWKRVEECENCKNNEKIEKINKIMLKNGFPESHIECRFTNYILYEDPDIAENQAKKKLYFNKLIENWGRKDIHPIIFMFGKTGTGKGHMACSLAYELISKKSLSCKIVKYDDLLRSIRNTFDKKGGDTEYSIIESYRICDLTIIDEVGMQQKESEWAMKMLYSVVDHRYESKMRTIIITNETKSKIGAYFKQHHGRLYSRIFASNNMILAFGWEDYRHNKNKLLSKDNVKE